MIHQEFNWISREGLNIFGQLWSPGAAPKGVVCLVHGLGEHSSRYKVLPGILTNEDFALIAFDQHGHGKSDGIRGHTPSYEAFMDNITELLGEAARRFPGIDRYLYGHSLGGNLVVNYALRYKPAIKGIIATGPWFRLTRPPSPLIRKTAYLLNKFWPSFRTSNGLKSADLAHQDRERREKEQDEYLHPWISVRTFVSAEEAGRFALEHAAELSYPVLLLHGSEDNVTSAGASAEFARQLHDKCSFLIFDGLYHEIHNEPKNQEIFGQIVSWLNKQSQLTPSK